MSTVFDFDLMKVQGAEGEDLVRDYFLSAGEEVVDLRESRDWQSRDVDFVVSGTTVEVKTDSHSPKNIFVELTLRGTAPGGLFKTRADLYCFVFPKYGIFYQVPVPELVCYVALHLGKYRVHEIRSNRGKRQWVNTGVAVPVEDLIAAGIHVEKFEIAR